MNSPPDRRLRGTVELREALGSELMVHFTVEGYKKGAEAFLNVLIPIIEKVRVGANAVSNN